MHAILVLLTAAALRAWAADQARDITVLDFRTQDCAVRARVCAEQSRSLLDAARHRLCRQPTAGPDLAAEQHSPQ